MKEIMIGLLIAFFTFASSIKILGWQKFVFDTQLAFFHKYGLNRAIMFLVGIIELTGAILLFLSLMNSTVDWFVYAGAGLIAITSIGAMFFHFRFDKFSDSIPSLVTLALSAFVLY